MSTVARIVALCLSFHVLAGAFAHDGDLAEFLVGKGKVQKGLCAVTSCVDPELLVQLAQKSGLLVHAFDADPNAAAEARDEAGMLGDRLIAERLPGPRLPYADNSIDLLIVPDLSDDTLQTTPLAEMLRVLRPRARAILGRQGRGEVLSADEMKGWLAAAGARDAVVSRGEFGLWTEIVKPAPEGVDRWSHWMHGPDNNPLSHDRVIRAPYLTQWMGKPYYMAMPVVTTAAGGRIFVASGHIAHHDREIPTLNLLCARNGYNGSILWTRKLPEGYLVHRSAFIAADDLFYLMDGQRCLLLDPETGEEKGSLRIPGVEGDWKWMALEGRTLYALVGEKGEKEPPAAQTLVHSPRDHWSWGELCKGYYEQPRIPWGFAATLAAYDLDRKETRWVHREPKAMDSRALGLLDGKLFFFSPESRIGCLDAKSGKLLWENRDAETLRLIEEPGKKLSSTPGFRTCCMLLCTPQAIFIEAQTHANVVALAAADGKILWTMPKTRSNPNLVFADGKLIIAGIGPKGNTLEVDPATGNVLRDLGFQKVGCTRLTASPEAFYCRGEGLGRYDRATGEYLVDGSVRPGCMDGAIPANGLLYVGPWLCDCNLSLMGTVTLCPAGDFRPDQAVREDGRLERGPAYDTSIQNPQSKIQNSDDWPTYRANNQRTAGSRAAAPAQVAKRWEFRPRGLVKLTAPAAVAGLVFIGGDDGKIRCIDAESGALRWDYATAGPIRLPPSVWEGRAFVGSGDGYIYALEAATGRLIWRFRAAPTERRIMVYGRLCSTWPVNSGVLVEDGVAYAAAGTIDRDGTYVYALDAKTGRLLWQNTETGHLDAKLRKGVSVQGDLTIAGGRLWMASGNQVSPVSYDLKTGRYIPSRDPMGRPTANRGSEVAVFRDRFVVHGGRSMYSGDSAVVSSAGFAFWPVGDPGQQIHPFPFFQRSSVPPAWDDDAFAFLTARYGGLVCWEANAVEKVLQSRRQEEQDLQKKVPDFWKRRGLLDELDVKMRKTGKWGPVEGNVLSLAMCRNAVVMVCQEPAEGEAAAAWVLRAHDKGDGRILWQQPLPSEPMLNGLTIDRNDRVLAALMDGGLVCFGGRP
ncbi:MAG: PQQ-binding-like beta-propeller repeat protein [Planctomycetota bacterium]